MWYYYRTETFNCQLDDSDVVQLDASVTLSTINTTGKYPEYHKVWEDDVLKVVAVFGKYEDGGTSNSDAGIAAYNRFTRNMKDLLGPLGLDTNPDGVPYNPGVDMPDIEFTADLGGGKSIEVVALLIDGVRTVGTTFNNRYGSLSGRADLIAYNGHSGLGANIRALARKGNWITGQYVTVFMNGCDTYAYVDDALLEDHQDVNFDDPTGTKYVDMITNAMPAFFHSTANATTTFIDGLMSYDEPQTFEKMFTSVDTAQVVLVSGEQDNVYFPGFGGGGGEEWDGLDESATIAQDGQHRFETPKLLAGKYLFEITGTGDVDLYVRVGTKPTLNLFDCRPFKSGSNESCLVSLAAPAPIHVMIHGYASFSQYRVVGSEQ